MGLRCVSHFGYLVRDQIVSTQENGDAAPGQGSRVTFFGLWSKTPPSAGIGRKADLDPESPVWAWLGVEGGTVDRGHGLDDAQPQPEPLSAARSQSIESFERLVQSLDVFGPYDRPVVGYAQARRSRSRAGRDRDTATVDVVAQSVVEQIPGQAFHQPGVATESDGPKVLCDVYGSGRRLGLACLQNPFDQHRQFDGLALRPRHPARVTAS